MQNDNNKSQQHPDHLISQQLSGTLEEEKIADVNEYFRELLHKIKIEAQLTEVEYGQLLLLVESNQIDGVCTILENCLKQLVYCCNDKIRRHNFDLVYQWIYKKENKEEKNVDIPPSLSLPYTTKDFNIVYLSKIE